MTETEEEKPRTLFVGNIPREVGKRQLEDIFGELGPLKRCHIQYPRNERETKSQDSHVAYITYALSEDAAAACKHFTGYSLDNKKLNIKFAKGRSQQVKQSEIPNLEPEIQKEKTKTPRTPRSQTVKKKSRIIIRNLSFQVNEDKLKKYFSSCGEIMDCNILRKPNGKLVGCAFIQYKKFPEAAKAIKELNLKEFLGRPIAIDWALPKTKFQEPQNSQDDEEEEDEKPEIKEEENEEDDVEVKEENDDDYDYVHDASQQKFPKEEIESDSDDDEQISKKERVITNDADEGKTLFVRNLDFDVTGEGLKEFFEQFGTLNYALICKDRLTEHPKGTGFVKFNDLENAEKCLKAFEEGTTLFNLGSRPMYICTAITKVKLEDKIKEKKNEKKTSGKDNRNLYLAREGFIRPASEAGEGVSTGDLNKRASLNQVKKQMLRNLSVFVSQVRLCVHNLPANMTDKKLKKLFAKHGGQGSKVIWAKVMKDMNSIDSSGLLGKSKGYGFVTFSKHEHALRALRAINNNPKIFSSNKRPIVEFSLENQAALKAKEKRLQKSKEKNIKVEIKVEPGKVKKEKKEKKNFAEIEQKKKIIQTLNSELPSEFSGLKSKYGTVSLPRDKPGKITRNSLKRSNKFKQQKSLKDAAQPINVKNIHDHIDKIISKRRIADDDNNVSTKRKKWFQ